MCQTSQRSVCVFMRNCIDFFADETEMWDKGPLAVFVLTLRCEACWQLGEIMLNGSDQRQRGGRRAQVKHEETEREAWLGQHAGRAWEGRRLAAGAPGVK